MFNRWIEPELLDCAGREGSAASRSPRSPRACSPTAISKGCRGLAAAQGKSLDPTSIEANLAEISALNEIAAGRGQTLAQLALAWVLRDSRVTSTLIGASSVQQLEDNVAATQRLDFTDDELAEIDRYAVDSGVDQWAEVRVGHE
jgi:L-glyceraldehyde 3-phosphate reductase